MVLSPDEVWLDWLVLSELVSDGVLGVLASEFIVIEEEGVEDQ